MPATHIGIIGGTGFYDLEGAEWLDSLTVETPFGSPSDKLRIGSWNGVGIAFLPRHGTRHTVPPHKINYRANIWALKTVGVRRVIALNAVGSLTKAHPPGTLGLVEQYIDLTKTRRNSFFDTGLTVHVTSADPVCADLVAILHSPPIKRGLTCVVIEGPRFNTRAEAQLQSSWGADLVNMTAMPEVALAREAQLCYAGLTVVADYDSCVDDASTTEDIIGTLRKHATQAQHAVRTVLTKIKPACPGLCQTALMHAIATPPDAQPPRLNQIAVSLGASRQDGWV